MFFNIKKIFIVCLFTLCTTLSFASGRYYFKAYEFSCGDRSARTGRIMWEDWVKTNIDIHIVDYSNYSKISVFGAMSQIYTTYTGGTKETDGSISYWAEDTNDRRVQIKLYIGDGEETIYFFFEDFALAYKVIYLNSI